jgi:starvation-inducible DNA-binding protein
MATLIDSLKNTLADSYTLYLKTQNYHWNVTGSNFASLHAMFETQYNDLFLAVDLIAERIRALGEKAPGTFSAYKKMTTISEGNENTSATEMVKELAQDQHKIIATLNIALKEAQKTGDEVTASIITDRLEIHQKNAWMLNASVA